MASLGDISVRLTADTSAFKAGLKGAAVAAAAVTAAIGAVVAGAVKMTTTMADTADEAAKAGKRVGMTAEAMQELGYAAGLSGASMADVEKGLGRLAANANDASMGVGDAKDAFKRLGISVTDSSGALKDQDTLLKETADAIAGLSNETEKVAIAQDIFGRAGKKILPMLNDGAAGMETAAKEARALGFVLSNEAAAAAEQFNDNLQRLEGATTGLKNELSVALLPVLDSVVTELTEMAKEMKGAGDVGDTTREVVVQLADAAAKLAPAITVASTAFGALVDGLLTLEIIADGIAISFQSLVVGFYAANDALQDTDKSAADYARSLAKLNALAATAEENTAKWGDATMDGVAAGQKMEQMLRRLADAAKDGAAQFDVFGPTMEDAGFKMGDLGENTRNTAKDFDGLKKSVDATAGSLALLIRSMDEVKSDVLPIIDEINNVGADVATDGVTQSYASPLDPASGPGQEATGEEAEPVDEEAERAKDALGGLASESTELSMVFAGLTGGIGALISMAVEMVTATEGFQRILKSVTGILDSTVGEMLEGTMGAIADIFEPFLDIVQELTPIIRAAMMAMDPVAIGLRLIAGAINLLAGPLGKLKDVTKKAVDWVSKPFQDVGVKLKDFAEDLAGIDKVTLDAIESINVFSSATKNLALWHADWLEAMGHVDLANEIRDQLFGDTENGIQTVGFEGPSGIVFDEVETASDAVGHFAGSLADAADATDKMAEAATSALNVPEIFRRSLRANQASDRSGGGGGGGGGPGSIGLGDLNETARQNIGLWVNGDVHVNADSESELSERMQRRAFVRGQAPGAGATITLGRA